MSHRSRASLISASLLAGLVAAGLSSSTGCDAAAPGSRAYRDGRFADAHAEFSAITADDGAAPELLYDRALAALRSEQLDDAVATLARARDTADDDVRPLLVFLTGNVESARAELAGRQARAPEAEPFAWDLAIRQAESARDAFRRAAATRNDWPEARRNAERAARLVARLRSEKAAADPNSRNASSPEVRLREGSTGADNAGQDTPPPSSSNDGEGADPATGALSELTPEEVTALLEKLVQKEREKLALRRSRRAADQADVERDW